jgi:hypothetical protein
LDKKSVVVEFVLCSILLLLLNALELWLADVVGGPFIQAAAAASLKGSGY